MEPTDVASDSNFWLLETDCIGGFRPVAEKSVYKYNGNFHVKNNDLVKIVVPAGCLVNQLNTKLWASDNFDNLFSYLPQDEDGGLLVFEWKAELFKPGTITFYFEYNNFDSGELCTSCKSKIIIDPKIVINNKILNFTGLCLQTVISHCLGPIDTWYDQIKLTAYNLNYHALHFTPFQVFGESGSCFSIADHFKVHPKLLPPNVSDDGFSLVKKTIESLVDKLSIISTTDIVLNHTASNTPWLKDHAECGFNELTAPHLKAAIELDVLLDKFSKDLFDNKLTHRLLINEIYNEEKLQNLIDAIKELVLLPFRIHEWFMMDTNELILNFRNFSCNPECNHQWNKSQDYKHDCIFNECIKLVGIKRFGVKPSIQILHNLISDANECEELLRHIQSEFFMLADNCFHQIVEAITGHIRWERVTCKHSLVGNTLKNSLLPRYFTPVQTKEHGLLHFANNGWVMNYNPNSDFAAPGCLHYLSRSIVMWTDCVKLRYGDKYEDSPFLWDYMIAYSKNIASIFHGLRLDNCHSTPLNFAKKCLNEIRRDFPSVLIYAELFTGNQDSDFFFERELGLNAVIREALQVHDTHMLGRRLEEYSNRSIGSLEPILSIDQYYQGRDYKLLLPKVSNCILYDCTHDNETPYQKRTAICSLPNSAAVASANCTSGSTRGYDELLPYKVAVIDDGFHYPDYKGSNNSTCIQIYTKLYRHKSTVMVSGSWDNWESKLLLVKGRTGWFLSIPIGETELKSCEHFEYKYYLPDEQIWFYDPHFPTVFNKEYINNVYRKENVKINCFLNVGMTKAKNHLNKIHQFLSENHYDEIKTEVIQEEILIIKRHQPKDHRYYIFILHMGMDPNRINDVDFVYTFEGELHQVVLEASLISEEPLEVIGNKGLSSKLHLSSNTLTSELNMFTINFNVILNATDVCFKSFSPGSVVVLSTKPMSKHCREKINEKIDHLHNQLHIMAKLLPTWAILELFNYVLFSCEPEEMARSHNKKRDSSLKYAGLAGPIARLDHLRKNFNRYDTLCTNVCSGNWLANYLIDRLSTANDCLSLAKSYKFLEQFKLTFQETFNLVLNNRRIPRELHIYYFDYILSRTYSCIVSFILSLFGTSLKKTSDRFVKQLCLSSLQFYGYIPSAINKKAKHTCLASLSAGLPHFATGYMRCWGRDTFIALTAYINLSEKISHVQFELFTYANSMKHGLIPNLLGLGENSRYNCRDSVWYFLQVIKQICETTHYKYEFLKSPIQLKYADELPEGTKIENLADLIHFILRCHVTGIHYRESNAGEQLDQHMTDLAFNVDIDVNFEDGFIYGGNKYNCGTWMDKMGSSDFAKNRGIPATPRDGAAIEINGLLCSILSFLVNVDKQFFPYEQLTQDFTYANWLNLVKENLDKKFFLDYNNNESINQGIYKDTLKASNSWQDTQFRPNACIALATAPGSFNVDHALSYLDATAKKLLNALTTKELQKLLESAINEAGDDISSLNNWFIYKNIIPLYTRQLGVKSLSPDDPNYKGFYDNSNQSNDFHIAQGYSYHNGPEWVWLLGYFLHALCSFLPKKIEKFPNFENLVDKKKFIGKYVQYECMKYLYPHREHISSNDWLSLPELTNENNIKNEFSCPAQAWSVGTILSFIYKLYSKNLF